MVIVTPASVSRFIDETERNADIIGLALWQNGQELVRFCKKPYQLEEPRLLFSLSKSFTSIGVGIAADLGILSLEDFVVSYFPDKCPPMISENLASLKVRHLLTMSCGIHENTYAELYVQDDWMKAFLAQDFVHVPGTHYRYSTHATYMLSAIVERAAHQSFYDFLKQHLLLPLEIENSSWEYCTQGITAGSMGLSVPLDAIAKFGQLLLDRGRYGGRQIVSAAYIEAATTPQISKGVSEKPSRSAGYGYQFHMDTVTGCFSANGAFGQLCYVVPQHNLVLAVASRNSKPDTIIKLLWDTALSEAIHQTNSTLTWPALYNQTAHLAVGIPKNSPHPSGQMINGTYGLAENANGLAYVQATQPDATHLVFRMCHTHHHDSEFLFNFHTPVHQRALFIKDINYHLQNYTSYACWRNDTTLDLTVFLTETPYAITCSLTFGDKKIWFDFHINVSFTLGSFACEGILRANVPS